MKDFICTKVHKSVLICQFSLILNFFSAEVAFSIQETQFFFKRCSSSAGSCLMFDLFLFFQHTTAINQISIDKSGDYVASCSDDGRVSTLKSCVVWV